MTLPLPSPSPPHTYHTPWTSDIISEVSEVVNVIFKTIRGSINHIRHFTYRGILVTARLHKNKMNPNALGNNIKSPPILIRVRTIDFIIINLLLLNPVYYLFAMCYEC